MAYYKKYNEYINPRHWDDAYHSGVRFTPSEMDRLHEIDYKENRAWIDDVYGTRPSLPRYEVSRPRRDYKEIFIHDEDTGQVDTYPIRETTVKEVKKEIKKKRELPKLPPIKLPEIHLKPWSERDGFFARLINTIIYIFSAEKPEIER